MNVVKSYGVACCRCKRTNDKQEYEILFIKKRLTYSFIEFINGRYNNKNLQYLLDGMTVNEKVVILTFNFKIIWYHGNMTLINNRRYIKAKLKFNDLYKHDYGKMLKHMVEISKNENLIWEIPKGRCKKNETPKNAAIREFEEETNINKIKYKILYDMEPLIYSFYDSGINYVYYYYIGVMLDNVFEPRVDYHANSMVFEVSDIQFISSNKIQAYNNDKSFISFIKKIIKVVKNYML